MQDFIYAQSQDFGELVSITPHLGDSAVGLPQPV